MPVRLSANDIDLNDVVETANRNRDRPRAARQIASGIVNCDDLSCR